MDPYAQMVRDIYQKTNLKQRKVRNEVEFKMRSFENHVLSCIARPRDIPTRADTNAGYLCVGEANFYNIVNRYELTGIFGHSVGNTLGTDLENHAPDSLIACMHFLCCESSTTQCLGLLHDLTAMPIHVKDREFRFTVTFSRPERALRCRVLMRYDEKEVPDTDDTETSQGDDLYTIPDRVDPEELARAGRFTKSAGKRGYESKGSDDDDGSDGPVYKKHASEN